MICIIIYKNKIDWVGMSMREGELKMKNPFSINIYVLRSLKILLFQYLLFVPVIDLRN